MEMLRQQNQDFASKGEQIQEGRVTRQVESVTAQMPSIRYLALAVGSMALSAGLMLSQRKDAANFVGLWAPSILVIGLYNKLVKVESEVLQLSQGQGSRVGSGSF